MIVVTQLIYIHKGQETVFDEFEAVAIPAISRYNGRLLFRLRPAADAYIESDIEPPYEIHMVEFAQEADLTAFMQDEERKRFLNLKEQSVRSMMLVKGENYK